jgi:hypothetical protein
MRVLMHGNQWPYNYLDCAVLYAGLETKLPLCYVTSVNRLTHWTLDIQSNVVLTN